jgi:hypothetical protein
MKTDDELFGGIDPEYKEMQIKLAHHKIERADALIKFLCKEKPADRDIILICQAREAKEFWKESLKW